MTVSSIIPRTAKMKNDELFNTLNKEKDEITRTNHAKLKVSVSTANDPG